MLPTMRQSGGEIRPARPHLVLKLKAGWRLDVAMHQFISTSGGRRFNPTDVLPKGAELRHMIPDLAGRKRLSQNERELARYVHLLLPKRGKTDVHLQKVRQWPCVEDAQLPPAVSLPR